MIKKIGFMAALTIMVGGCSNGHSPRRNAPPLPLKVTAEIVTPRANGTFERPLVQALGDTVRKGGSGVAYRAGLIPGTGVGEFTGVAGYAGLLPGASVSNPTANRLTYNANYGVTVIRNIDVVDRQIQGKSNQFRGNIVLNANFNAGTITGSDGNLTVGGTVTGTSLGGTVEFHGLSGKLTGLAGGDKTYGAFHGATDETILVGGFSGTSR